MTSISSTINLFIENCVNFDNLFDTHEETPDIHPCDVLTEPLLKRILEFLPFDDLMMCRKVSKAWSHAASETESFLSSSVLHVSLEPWNTEVISETQIPWRHIRLKLFDIQEHLSQGKKPQLPSCLFLHHIKTIEFRQCIVSWTTIKKIMLSTPNVDHLIISRCLFQESEPEEIDTEMFTAAFGQMSQFSFTDVTDIRGIMACLQKLIIYGASNIKMLEVNYNPYFSRVTPDLASEFCTVLGHLLQNNAMTLRTLILDLRCTEILNFFCPIVLSRLETYYCVMKLEVFELANPIFGGPNVSITYEAPRALLMFSEFFSILSATLKSVAIPHLQNMGPYEGRRWQIADHVPRKIQKFRVPGPQYLKRNFLKTFVNLKEFFIGEKACPGQIGLMNPTKYVYDYRAGIVRANCRVVRTLGIFAKLNYESGKLYHIIEKFPMLVKFELDALRPLLDDKDLQAIIKRLPLLKYLAITHCDLISDHGLTGIPLETCKNLFKLSTIYMESDLEGYKLRKDGVPLSQLEGLETLLLSGSAKLSDVGLKLGLEFIGLQTLQLPWSEKITEWGIQKMGRQNPSLRSLTLTGATPASVIGCTQLLNEHSRLVKQNLKIQSINEQQNDEFASPSLLTGILWDP